MRWNQTRAADLLTSGRSILSDIAARTGPHSIRQSLPPAAQPLPRAPLAAPTDDDALIDDWLTRVSQPARIQRPAPPSDFTARVMARLEASPDVAPRPIPPARSRPTTIEHLCLVGGVVGISILLVTTTCLLTALLAPNAIFTVLNTVVAALVAVFLLLGPLLDALSALATNPSLMCALLMLIAGALALWSRVLHPAARLTGEA